ncbi:MAG: Holliday junction branch migration protein RuvA [Bacilli bacterium]|nr:Holliday junction branch migration protein RuvA [Bacilli bacterium]MDD3389502.1 Holliday junction branch migration protein RuvA [Bacilli bacterium]MDD4345094.1 Holliday junction branch migration protein RuvA [Bacilli bacterium]MDD4521125.1 Holliday junction branch migration protein RuvA [Bacilli bacterium]MDY0399841.1 Holliday junction branch migration protein RuvA [Bacilli bacterium]
MLYQLKGFVRDVQPNAIVLDVHDVGYLLYVAHPEDFPLGALVDVLTQMVVREDDIYLIGFSDAKEKQAFNDLIKVSGIGPKTALNALAFTRPDTLYQAIALKDVRFLKKLPGIGPKAANQIILDIKGQLVNETALQEQRKEVVSALKNLGFKNQEISKVLTQVDQKNLTDEEVLKAALKALRK